jgi:hypothetical protein
MMFHTDFINKYIHPIHFTSVMTDLKDNNVIHSIGLANAPINNSIMITCRMNVVTFCYFLTNDERRRVIRTIRSFPNKY